MDNELTQIVVGKKQILRLVKENALKSIWLATDVDKDYAKPILDSAKIHNVRVDVFGTREEISSKYGIDVPSGAVGFLK